MIGAAGFPATTGSDRVAVATAATIEPLPTEQPAFGRAESYRCWCATQSAPLRIARAASDS